MELKKQNPNPKSQRIGRGGKRGKTSGRGHKGQHQHGGHGIRPEERDIIKRLPKLRGYKFNSYKPRPVTFNLSVIEAAFNAGETVNADTLIEKGLLTKRESTKRDVKILGTGDVTKKLTIEHLTLSSTAASKIEAAGGTIVK